MTDLSQLSSWSFRSWRSDSVLWHRCCCATLSAVCFPAALDTACTSTTRARVCGSWLHAAHASLWSLQPRVLNTPPAACILIINHVNEETMRLRIDLLPERINNKRERGTFGLYPILLHLLSPILLHLRHSFWAFCITFLLSYYIYGCGLCLYNLACGDT